MVYMAFELTDKLVIAVASSALFDLSESDKVFREEKENAYRRYQRENENNILGKGVAFALIKRLLEINSTEKQLVEVILLSRNDPDTGLRVFKSIESYGLTISRAIFVAGQNPFKYMEAINASLFLSGNLDDVKEAIKYNFPAGYVKETDYQDDETEQELRLAFDFDGVIVDDASETVYKKGGGLLLYQQHEREHANELMGEGPLFRLLKQISEIQKYEISKFEEDDSYQPKIRIALCTARNAPAHERVVKTLREYDIRIDEAFFLGGVNKNNVLKIYKPHIFFDDQLEHIDDVAKSFPSVHIPYGVANESDKEVEKAGN